MECHEIPHAGMIGKLLIHGCLNNRPNERVNVRSVLDRRQFCDTVLFAVDADVLNLSRDVEKVATDVRSRFRVRLKERAPPILPRRQT